MSFFERNELKRQLEESNPDKFRSAFGQWISMPCYSPNSHKFEVLSTICDPKRTPQVESFLTDVRARVKGQLDESDHEGAVNVLTDAYQRATKEFQGDVVTTVHRHIYFRTGFVYEYKATYGDLSHRPLGDRQRTECFLKAATCYMNADIIVGHVSDYAARVAESLGGAGELYGSYQTQAIRKLFGENVIVVGSNNPAGQVIAKDLERRSKDVQKGIVPGGGNASFVSKEDLPDGNNN